jgi:hypothetical protein
MPLPLLGQLEAIDVAAELHLDRKEPRPRWFEYVPQDGGLVTIANYSRHSSRYLGLYKYNDQFGRSWRKRIFENNRRKKIEHLAVLDNSILVFVSEDLYGEKRYETAYYQFSLDGRELTERRVIDQQAERREQARPLQYERSLDKRQLVCYRQAPEPSQEHLALTYYQFAASERKIREGTLKLPVAGSRVSLQRVRVGNDGKLYILVRKKNARKIREPADADHYLFMYSPQSEALYKRDLDLAMHFVTDLDLKVARNGNLILAGLYGSEAYGEFRGVLYQRIYVRPDSLAPSAADSLRNDTLPHDSLILRNTVPLSRSLLQRYLNDRQIERGQGLRDIFLDYMILRSDGGLLLLTEQYYQSTSSFRDVYGFWYTQDVYHYDDIIMISVSPAGEIEWSSVVDKSQVGENARQLSYTHYVGARYIYLFYKNRRKGFGTNVYVRRVDFRGSVSTPKPFFENFRDNDVFYREASEQVANGLGILVYYRNRGNTFSMLKLRF